MFARRLFVCLVFACVTLARLTAAPPTQQPAPKPPMPQHKTPPQQHHAMNQHHHPNHHHPTHHYPPGFPYPYMPYIPILTAFQPYLPYYPQTYNTNTNTAQPATSMAGLDRELVLPLASDAALSQLKPGSLTVYQPAQFDALKPQQLVTVLVKPEKPTDRPLTWTLTARVVAAEDGAPRQLTLLAKLDPAQGEFDPAMKVITAVTIKAQPAVAQK